MRLLIIAFLAFAATCEARKTGNYTVDSGGVVTVDRDMNCDDLKIHMDKQSYESKNSFNYFEGDQLFGIPAQANLQY